MIKVLSVDISGRVFLYDHALYNALSNSIKEQMIFIGSTPYKTISNSNKYCRFTLSNYVPIRYASSSSIFKRVIKAWESIINYIKISSFIANEKPNVLHLQWLPFIEFCSIEHVILKYIKRVHPSLCVVLTIHNTYPHNCSFKVKYRNRFLKITSLIDKFVVHTQSTLKEISNEFHIDPLKIHVIKHGVFVPKSIPQRERTDNKTRLLLFGYQSLYKGTDLLIDAVNILGPKFKNRLEVRIIGKMSSELLNKFHNVDYNLYVRDEYVSDEALYEEIVNSDLLIYPYRAISQSGALLLGLYFNKIIITSNLPSFIETLESYPPEMFFKAGNAISLSEVIKLYLNSDEDFKSNLHDILTKIKQLNSWDSAAHDTIKLYNDLIIN